MRILFNLMNTGLGNNGGSLTLIKSANTLVGLGHDVIVIDSGINQNSWIPLNCNHIIIKNPSEIPDADVIIATGMKSIDSTNQSKIENKYIWIRGWELWVYPEETLVQTFRNSPCKKLVNSLCLQNKLMKYGIDSYLVRPGYDFDELYPKGHRNLPAHNFINIGGLFNRGKKRAGKRTEWILEVLKMLSEREKEYKIGLWMYGTEEVGPSGNIRYFSNPQTSQKNDIYNAIDIWLAPTNLEGLHIPPAEAMLTKCPVVGTCVEMNGMDYLFNYKTGLISYDNLESFYNKVVELIKDRDLRNKLGNNGREMILSLGDRKENMRRMISILEGSYGREG